MRALFLAAAIALVSSPAAASPEDIYGYGDRSPAMGGTGAASSKGFEAAYTNPALLSTMREKALTLGFQAGAFDLHADGDGLPGRVPYQPMRGIVIGAGFPIPFGGVLKDRIGAAFAFYTPTDVIVRGKILYPETPQFPLLPDRSQSLAVRAGFGADIGWGVRVGAGFAALAEIAGSVLVATDATGRVGSRVEDQLVATYAPTLGVTWDLPFGSREAKWRVGATYRGRLDARFAVEIDATKLSSLNIPIFNIAGVAQYDPAQIALEVAHERGPWTLAAGGVLKKWSDYPGLIEPTILCPADSDCSALQPTHVPFSNTLVLRAGAERAFALGRGATAFARAGVFREPTPTPSTLAKSQAYDPATRTTIDVPTRFFDADRWAITLGGGVAMKDPLPPLAIDFWAQYHVLVSRSLDVETTNGATISGHVLAIGFLGSVKF